MASLIAPLDTPRKASLQVQATQLRTALKDFERQYADGHDGRKPGKEIIKADAALAAKYKEYNKIRDVLDGKIGLEALDNNSTHRRQSSRLEDAGSNRITLTSYVEQTPRSKRTHPNDFDPYDLPLSNSPKHTFLTAIGPTPQRDGQILGIFDMLFNSGSGSDSQATPSSKKRKRDALAVIENNGQGLIPIAQTPSQRKSKHSGDILDHLAGGTPSTNSAKRHKMSRTPASDGKKFMLSQFFETPSAARYANMVVSPNKTIGKPTLVNLTPLRTKVLGLTPTQNSKDQTANDATPAYLKRSFSFKDRLLSVTTTDSQQQNKPLDFANISTIRRGSKTTRHVQSQPKPLSQIVSDLKSIEEQRYDDDLDALREMEGDEVNVIVGDSQEMTRTDTTLQPGEQPTRVWKKKGQKRTTRRAIMRPTKVKRKKENRFVDAQEEKDNTDHDDEEYDNDQQDDVTRIEETQLQSSNTIKFPDEFDIEDDDDLQPLQEPRPKPDQLTSSRNNADEDNVTEDEYVDEDDFTAAEEHLSPQPTFHSKDRKIPQTVDKEDKAKSKVHSKSLNSDVKKKKTAGMINPNAQSHMNFRSLKIRNKNSKAKGSGRGRFGKRR